MERLASWPFLGSPVRRGSTATDFTFSGASSVFHNALARKLPPPRCGRARRLNPARYSSMKSALVERASGTLRDAFITPRLTEPLGVKDTYLWGATGRGSSGAFGWSGADGTLYRIGPEPRLVMLPLIQLAPNAAVIRTDLSTLVSQEFVEVPASVDADATR